MASDRPHGDFGSTLREARERRGISLRQIATKTKISVVALEALERNDVSRLPGGIFSRAFVRSYAVEVGLEPEHTIQEFIAHFPQDSVTAGHPQAAQVEDHQAVDSDRRTAVTFVRLIAVSVPIAVAVLYFSMRGSQPVSPDGPPRASAGLPAPSASAAPPGGSGAAPAPLPSAQPPSAAAGGVLTVELVATRECWVSATADGEKVIERLLQPGERTTVQVRDEFLLTAGDAAAIGLTLNGAPARPLGGDGQVVNLKLNPANFQEYLTPR